MQSLHHITIGSYYVDGLPADPVGQKRKDRKTAIGIYAADKPFSKGGKLTLRASIPARLNNHDMPTLKEAKAILLGASVEESDAWRDPAYAMIFVRQALRLQSAAVANGCTEEEAARGYTFKEVRGDYVATVRRSSGNRGVFWLATLTHKGARIENDLRYNSSEHAQALAVSWLNKHSPVEVEGPKEEAWNYTSGGALKAAQHAIDCALEQTPGSIEGCRLTLDYPSIERGYVFIMWADINGKVTRNTLAASVTDVARLSMHWAGFVDNVRAARKAVAGAALACASFGPSDMAAVNASAAAAPVEQDRYMFIADQYGIDVCPAMDAAIDAVRDGLQNQGVLYDTGITLSYLGL